MMKTQRLVMFVAALCWCAGVGTAFAGAEDGKKLFDGKKCIACHSLAQQKGAMAKVGGALDGVGAKRDAAWLKGYLADPKSKVPNAKMPKQKFTDQEIDALAEYMLSLK